MSNPSFKSVDPLTPDQIAQFKRDGFLVLEGALDPELCRQARDEMWEVIQAHLPRMRRNDPSTWGPITEEENAKLQHRPEGGGDPYFNGNGHRYTVRNGASELMLNLAPRALWQVAEQLLGAGTVVWPVGLDESGYTTGPCFMCDDAVGGLNSHVGHSMGWPSEGTFTTEPALRLPPTGTGVAQRTGNSWAILYPAEQSFSCSGVPRCPLRRCVLRSVASADVSVHFRRAAQLRRIYRVARESLADLARTVEGFQGGREAYRQTFGSTQGGRVYRSCHRGD